MNSNLSFSIKKQQKRYIKLKQEFPRNEMIALLTPLFKLLESRYFAKYERMHHLLELITHNLDLAEKHIANTKDSIDTQLKIIGEKNSIQDQEKWLSLGRMLNQVKKDGALSSGRLMAQYAALLNRYEYNASTQIAMVPSLDTEISKLSQLYEYADVYRFLYRIYFQLFAQSGKGPLHEVIEQLGGAIRTGNLADAHTTSLRVRSLLQPTRVLEIPKIKEGKIFENSIDIIGIAHQLIELEVSVDGERQQRLLVDIDGTFCFKKVRLKRGENNLKIACISVPPVLFKDELNIEFKLVCHIALFFFTRIDALTQEPFNEAEIDQWVRCKKCGTLSLRVSWGEFGKCYHCGSIRYWQSTEPEFHEKEIFKEK